MPAAAEQEARARRERARRQRGAPGRPPGGCGAGAAFGHRGLPADIPAFRPGRSGKALSFAMEPDASSGHRLCWVNAEKERGVSGEATE
ncbi:hypothetical protein GCM10009727_26720 [Actinomadura napierensis]|uniref:Uncharacterized protein n=1 Tax=Actinomadura napierensis TaxID=267854 RepID=A0ABP5KNU1_9ACTN